MTTLGTIPPDRRLELVVGPPGADEESPGSSNLTALGTIPPARRPELVVGPPGADGQCVVKDPRAGRYFQLGEQEAFLLAQLDGQRTGESIRAAFEAEFGEPLSEGDLDEFLEVAREGGLLQSAKGPGAAVADDAVGFDDEDDPESGSPPTADPAARPRRRQRLLYWRKSLFDPDRLLGWLEPKLRFVWTGPFLVISAGCILAAAALVWSDRWELVSRFPAALRWDLLALAWLTVLLLTALHEFAHGLTCKHFGGEVHEIGFLLMYFMPCFYCNVSDAWLFPEKSKRLWVTLAGGYCDMVMWALAVFTWRMTLPGSLLSHLACLVLSVCGARIFFNFNPLLKLDGYYLVSDLMEMPNLRRRAWESVTGHLRWLLWGAPRPASEPRGRLLLGFGVVTWLYSMVFLGLMLIGFAKFLDRRWGPAAISFTLFMATVRVRRRFRGILTGEVAKMIRKRRKRSALWALGLIALPTVLAVGRMEDRAGGPFQIRPATRVELRAPVAGFLRTVAFDEGDRVSPGQLVARLEVPDLDSRIKQGQAERREARARLRLLEVGPRPEQIEQQRLRVERAEAWRDMAARDLGRMQQAFREELERLKERVAQARAEVTRAEGVRARSTQLRSRGAVSEEQYWKAEADLQIALAREKQAEAQERARRAEATLEAEAELARREKGLAEARAALALLEAGSRPEELDAARARLERVGEEVSYLEGLRDKVLITSPVSGVITTPRLKERVGLFLREGEPICELEALSVIEAEIAVGEQDVVRVRPGQEILLKARALPFEIFHARVDRIAPSTPRANAAQAPGGPALEARGAAAAAEQWGMPGIVIVYCRPEGPLGDLRSGMTGYAWIHCGRRPIGEILVDRVSRVLRTEFWWWGLQ